MTSTHLQTMNFKSLIAPVAALSLAFAGATFVPEAKACITCSHENFIGTTTCYGPNGMTRGTHDNFLRTSTWTGPSGNSTTCTHDDFINTTTYY